MLVLLSMALWSGSLRAVIAELPRNLARAAEAARDETAELNACSIGPFTYRIILRIAGDVSMGRWNMYDASEGLIGRP
jgi:hypothetical protein